MSAFATSNGVLILAAIKKFLPLQVIGHYSGRVFTHKT